MKVVDKDKVCEFEVSVEKMVNDVFRELNINFDQKSSSSIIVDGRDADLNTLAKPDSVVVITPNIYNG